MTMLSQLNINVFDRKTRKLLDDMTDSRIRRLWFENYEANKEMVKKWGGVLDNCPKLDEAIVVGAGWSLDKNIWKLKGVNVPVIVCDKSAWRVGKFVKPFAITALNTEKTEVSQWLDKFRQTAKEMCYDIDDIWLIAPVTVDPEVFTFWSGKVAFTNPQNTCQELNTLVYQETGIVPTLRGSNVGLYSIITAVSLGVSKAVILGMPFCYQTREEARAAGRKFGFCYIQDINQKNPFDKEFGMYVFCTFEWLDMRSEAINFCMDVLADVRFINCSEGGILYEEGVIEPCDFGAWKTFLTEQGGPNDTKRAKESDGGQTPEGDLGKELPC